MLPVLTLSGNGGHPRGGPRCIWGVPARAAVLLLAAAVLLPACSLGGAGAGTRPARDEPFSRPLDIYRDLGFMTGSGQFPAVASFSTLAGPADSTWVMIALSIPNNALRFNRDGDGFAADYSIDLDFLDADSASVRRLLTQERVRISSFTETARSEESIVFQQAVAMPPGRYIVRLQASDLNSARGLRMTDTLTVPVYGMDRGHPVSAPVLVYQGDGRERRDQPPQLIFNPRHTVEYGGQSPLVYVEAYGSEAAVPVRVVNDQDRVVWAGSANLRQGDQLRFGVVEIPASALPLGRFWVEVGDSAVAAPRAPLLMTISDQWMVANFDEVIRFLRLIAFDDELDSLRTGTPVERREAWERFWDRRDPLEITENNEYRDAFFQRVRYATEAFREPGGRAGWDTDRGEVYIVLGPPDQAIERFVGGDATARPNAEEWEYVNTAGGRLTLLFHDRSGFGRYELIPSSESAFRTVADRLKRSLPERR